MRDNFGRTGFHLLAYQANIHRINQVFNYLFHKDIKIKPMITDKKGLIMADILLLKVEIKNVEKLREICKGNFNLEIFNENIIFRLKWASGKNKDHIKEEQILDIISSNVGDGDANKNLKPLNNCYKQLSNQIFKAGTPIEIFRIFDEYIQNCIHFRPWNAVQARGKTIFHLLCEHIDTISPSLPLNFADPEDSLRFTYLFDSLLKASQEKKKIEARLDWNLGDKHFQQSGLHILAGKGRFQEISHIVMQLLRSGLKIELQSRNSKGNTIAELLKTKDLYKEVCTLDKDCVKWYKVKLLPPCMQVELMQEKELSRFENVIDLNYGLSFKQQIDLLSYSHLGLSIIHIFLMKSIPVSDILGPLYENMNISTDLCLELLNTPEQCLQLTPFNYASHYSNWGTIKYFLSTTTNPFYHKMDVICRRKNGSNCLFGLIENKNLRLSERIEGMEILLKVHPDLAHFQDKLGFTPLTLFMLKFHNHQQTALFKRGLHLLGQRYDPHKIFTTLTKLKLKHTLSHRKLPPFQCEEKNYERLISPLEMGIRCRDEGLIGFSLRELNCQISDETNEGSSILELAYRFRIPLHLIKLFLSKLSKTVWKDVKKYKSYSGIILKIVKEDYIGRSSCRIAKSAELGNTGIIRIKEGVKGKEGEVEDPQYVLRKKGGREFLMGGIENVQSKIKDDYLSKYLSISWERIATGNGRLFLKFLSTSILDSLTLPWDLPQLPLNQFRIKLNNNKKKKPTKPPPHLKINLHPIDAYSSALDIFLHSILYIQKPPFIHICTAFKQFQRTSQINILITTFVKLGIEMCLFTHNLEYLQIIKAISKKVFDRSLKQILGDKSRLLQIFYMSSIFVERNKPIIFNDKMILSNFLEIPNLELKLFGMTSKMIIQPITKCFGEIFDKEIVEIQMYYLSKTMLHTITIMTGSAVTRRILFNNINHTIALFLKTNILKYLQKKGKLIDYLFGKEKKFEANLENRRNLFYIYKEQTVIFKKLLLPPFKLRQYSLLKKILIDMKEFLNSKLKLINFKEYHISYGSFEQEYIYLCAQIGNALDGLGARIYYNEGLASLMQLRYSILNIFGYCPKFCKCNSNLFPDNAEMSEFLLETNDLNCIESILEYRNMNERYRRIFEEQILGSPFMPVHLCLIKEKPMENIELGIRTIEAYPVGGMGYEKGMRHYIREIENTHTETQVWELCEGILVAYEKLRPTQEQPFSITNFLNLNTIHHLGKTLKTENLCIFIEKLLRLDGDLGLLYAKCKSLCQSSIEGRIVKNIPWDKIFNELNPQDLGAQGKLLHYIMRSTSHLPSTYPAYKFHRPHSHSSPKRVVLYKIWPHGTYIYGHFIRDWEYLHKEMASVILLYPVIAYKYHYFYPSIIFLFNQQKPHFSWIQQIILKFPTQTGLFFINQAIVYQRKNYEDNEILGKLFALRFAIQINHCYFTPFKIWSIRQSNKPISYSQIAIFSNLIEANFSDFLRIGLHSKLLVMNVLNNLQIISPILQANFLKQIKREINKSKNNSLNNILLFLMLHNASDFLFWLLEKEKELGDSWEIVFALLQAKLRYIHICNICETSSVMDIRSTLELANKRVILLGERKRILENTLQQFGYPEKYIEQLLRILLTQHSPTTKSKRNLLTLGYSELYENCEFEQSKEKYMNVLISHIKECWNKLFSGNYVEQEDYSKFSSLVAECGKHSYYPPIADLFIRLIDKMSLVNATPFYYDVLNILCPNIYNKSIPVNVFIAIFRYIAKKMPQEQKNEEKKMEELKEYIGLVIKSLDLYFTRNDDVYKHAKALISVENTIFYYQLNIKIRNALFRIIEVYLLLKSTYIYIYIIYIVKEPIKDLKGLFENWGSAKIVGEEEIFNRLFIGSPIYAAICSGNEECVLLVLDKDCDNLSNILEELIIYSLRKGKEHLAYIFLNYLSDVPSKRLIGECIKYRGEYILSELNKHRMPLRERILCGMEYCAEEICISCLNELLKEGEKCLLPNYSSDGTYLHMIGIKGLYKVGMYLKKRLSRDMFSQLRCAKNKYDMRAYTCAIMCGNYKTAGVLFPWEILSNEIEYTSEEIYWLGRVKSNQGEYLNRGKESIYPIYPKKLEEINTYIPHVKRSLYIDNPQIESFADLFLSGRYTQAMYLLERRPDVYYFLCRSPLEIYKRAIKYSSHHQMLLLNTLGVLNVVSDSNTVVDEILKYSRERGDAELFIYVLAPIWDPPSGENIYNNNIENIDHPLLQKLEDIDLTLSLPETVSKYANSLVNPRLLDIMSSPTYSTAGSYLHSLGEKGLYDLLLLLIKYFPSQLPPLLTQRNTLGIIPYVAAIGAGNYKTALLLFPWHQLLISKITSFSLCDSEILSASSPPPCSLPHTPCFSNTNIYNIYIPSDSNTHFNNYSYKEKVTESLFHQLIYREQYTEAAVLLRNRPDILCLLYDDEGEGTNSQNKWVISLYMVAIKTNRGIILQILNKLNLFLGNKDLYELFKFCLRHQRDEILLYLLQIFQLYKITTKGKLKDNTNIFLHKPFTFLQMHKKICGSSFVADSVIDQAFDFLHSIPGRPVFNLKDSDYEKLCKEAFESDNYYTFIYLFTYLSRKYPLTREYIQKLINPVYFPNFCARHTSDMEYFMSMSVGEKCFWISLPSSSLLPITPKTRFSIISKYLGIDTGWNTVKEVGALFYLIFRYKSRFLKQYSEEENRTYKYISHLIRGLLTIQINSTVNTNDFLRATGYLGLILSKSHQYSSQPPKESFSALFTKDNSPSGINYIRGELIKNLCTAFKSTIFQFQNNLQLTLNISDSFFHSFMKVEEQNIFLLIKLFIQIISQIVGIFDESYWGINLQSITLDLVWETSSILASFQNIQSISELRKYSIEGQIYMNVNNIQLLFENSQIILLREQLYKSFLTETLSALIPNISDKSLGVLQKYLLVNPLARNPDTLLSNIKLEIEEFKNELKELISLIPKYQKDKLGLTEEIISSLEYGEYSGINLKLCYLPYKSENEFIEKRIEDISKLMEVNVYKFRKLKTANIWFTIKNRQFSLIKESFSYYPLFRLHEITRLCNNYHIDCESMYQVFHSVYMEYKRRGNMKMNMNMYMYKVWNNELDFISDYLRESRIFRVLIDSLHYEILAKERDPRDAIIGKYPDKEIDYAHNRLEGVPTSYLWTDTIATSNHFYDIRHIIQKLTKKSIKFVNSTEWEESMNYIPEPKCYIDSILKIGDVRYKLNSDETEIVIYIYIHNNDSLFTQHIEQQPPIPTSKIIEADKLAPTTFNIGEIKELKDHSQENPAWDAAIVLWTSPFIIGMQIINTHKIQQRIDQYIKDTYYFYFRDAKWKTIPIFEHEFSTQFVLYFQGLVKDHLTLHQKIRNMYEGLKLEFNIKECREFKKITRNTKNDLAYTLSKLSLTKDTKLSLTKEEYLRAEGVSNIPKLIQCKGDENKQIIAKIPIAIKDRIEQLPLILLSYDLFHKFQTSKLFSDSHFSDLEFEEGLISSGRNTYHYRTKVHITEKGSNRHILCWVNEKYKEIFQIPEEFLIDPKIMKYICETERDEKRDEMSSSIAEMEENFVVNNSLIEEDYKIEECPGLSLVPYYIRMNKENWGSECKLNEIWIEFSPKDSEKPLTFKCKSAKYFLKGDDYIISERVICSSMEWMWDGIINFIRENNSERIFIEREEWDISQNIQDPYYLEHRTPLDKININFQFAEDIDEYKLFISTSPTFVSDLVSIIEHIFYSIRDISANPIYNQLFSKLDNLIPFAFSSTTLLHQKRITTALFRNFNSILIYFVKDQTALKFNTAANQLEIQISLIFNQSTREIGIKEMPCKENIQQTMLCGLIQKEISKIREAIKYVCDHPNDLENINLTRELHFEESIILENYTYSVYLLAKIFHQSFLFKSVHKYNWLSIEFVGYPEISCCLEQFMNIVHLPLILNNIAVALKIVDSSRSSRRNTKRGMIKEMYVILEKGVEKQNIELGKGKITFKLGEVKENMTSENIAKEFLRELSKLNNSDPEYNIGIGIFPLKETASKMVLISTVENMRNERLNFKVEGLGTGDNKLRALLVPLNISNCSDYVEEVVGETNYSGELFSVLFSELKKGDLYEMVIIYKGILLASRIMFIYNSKDELPAYLADSLITTKGNSFGQIHSQFITINDYRHYNPINLHVPAYLPIITSKRGELNKYNFSITENNIQIEISACKAETQRRMQGGEYEIRKLTSDLALFRFLYDDEMMLLGANTTFIFPLKKSKSGNEYSYLGQKSSLVLHKEKEEKKRISIPYLKSYRYSEEGEKSCKKGSISNVIRQLKHLFLLQQIPIEPVSYLQIKDIKEFYAFFQGNCCEAEIDLRQYLNGKFLKVNQKIAHTRAGESRNETVYFPQKLKNTFGPNIEIEFVHIQCPNLSVKGNITECTKTCLTIEWNPTFIGEYLLKINGIMQLFNYDLGILPSLNLCIKSFTVLQNTIEFHEIARDTSKTIKFHAQDPYENQLIENDLKYNLTVLPYGIKYKDRMIASVKINLKGHFRVNPPDTQIAFKFEEGNTGKGLLMCVAISFSEINDLEEKIQKDLEIFEFRLFTNDILFFEKEFFITERNFENKYVQFVATLPVRRQSSYIHVNRFTFLSSLCNYSAGVFHDNINVEYINEAGIDAGGLKREFFDQFFQEIKDKKYILQKDDYYVPNPHGHKLPNFEKIYKHIGGALGFAISEGQHADFPINPGLYRYIFQNKHCPFTDLFMGDREAFKSFQDLFKYSEEELNMLEMYFTVADEVQGKEVELISEGEKLKVNQSNLNNFVNLYADYILRKQYKIYFKLIKEGFLLAMSLTHVRQFSFSDINKMIIGIDDITPKLILDRTRINVPDPLKTYFIEYINTSNQRELRKLLKFATGTTRFGYGQKIILVIDPGDRNEKRLPIAHTCFRSIELPNYSTSALLDQKMRLAVNYGAAYFAQA